MSIEHNKYAEIGPGCEGCKFILRTEEGYSEYTITGMSVACLKKVNPLMPLSDEDVGSRKFNDALAFGETCTARVEGIGPWYTLAEDSPTKESYKDDEELFDLLTAYEAS